jgi:EPS-associated MarR family transcriptional regulator
MVLKSVGKVTSQNSIAKDIGYSVGKVNYVLKALAQKGLVKVEKLANTKKINQYSYLLTEKGIKEKITLTEKFIEKKKKEYDQLQADLERYKQMDEYKKIFESN